MFLRLKSEDLIVPKRDLDPGFTSQALGTIGVVDKHDAQHRPCSIVM